MRTFINLEGVAEKCVRFSAKDTRSETPVVRLQAQLKRRIAIFTKTGPANRVSTFLERGFLLKP